MKDIRIFSNEQFGQVRVVEQDGEPWFVAADVCKALEIGNSRMALERLDADEKADVSLTDTSYNGVVQDRHHSIVNEPGLYTLVLGSRKKEAKLFKRWITHDVIPSIRKHGGYLTPEMTERVLSDPDTIIRLATELKKERTRRIELEGQNAEQKKIIDDYAPKVDLYEKYAGFTGTKTATDIAQACGFKSAAAMNKFLQEKGVLRRDSINGTWHLTAKYCGNGYTAMRQCYVEKGRYPYIRTVPINYTVWTIRGYIFLAKQIFEPNGYKPSSVEAVFDLKNL